MPINPKGYANTRFINPIQTEGDAEERHRSGVLGDVFDLLSRTSRASAQATYNATDKDNSTSFLGGLGQGLSGKGEVTYKDVLKDNLGIENRLVSSIGGLIGDVALDPLTYVGIKATKGVGEADALIQALKSGSDDIALTSAEIMAKNPMRVGLTVAGKEFGSVKLPKTGMVEKLLGPVENRKLGPQMFARDAELPLGLNEMSRVIDSSHAAQFSDFRHGLRDAYRGLTPEERRMVSIALDKGERNTTPVALAGTGRTKFNTIQEYVDFSKNITDNLFLDEAKTGLFKQKKGAAGKAVDDFEGYNPNYVYRYFKDVPTNDIPGADNALELKALGTTRADFMKMRTKDVSLEKAEELKWNPVTDIVDIMDMRAAKHYRTMSSASLVKDAVDQFSIHGKELSKVKGLSKDLKWRKASDIESPIAAQFGDRYVPEFVVRSLNQVQQTLKKGDVGAEAVKLHDKIMRQWKFLNTAAMPGYHIRNTLGDAILNMADGVRSPVPYSKAAKVIADRDSIAMRTLDQLASPELATVIPKGERVVKIGGKNLSTDEVWNLYNKSGSKSGLITSEVQRSLTDGEKIAMGNALKVAKAKIGDFADTREDFMRLGHFIDKLDKTMKSKGYKGTIEDAAMEAGKSVRKFNIDYGNLSTFERRTVNKLIPFYSWMRRATPLNIELMFTKPGFMALYPKGQDLMQGLLGTDDGNGEMLIPDWIREMAPVRVALGKQEERNFLQNLIARAVGAGNNEAAFLSTTTGMTPIDTLQAPVGVLQGLLGGNPGEAGAAAAGVLSNGLTPLIKAPVELATGKSLFTGQEQSAGDWAANLIGPSRVFNKGVLQGNKSTLLSTFTGLPIQVATASRQEGEFRRRQDVVSAANSRAKREVLQQRIPNFNNLSEAKQESLLRNVRNKQDPAAKQQRRYLTQILGQ